MYQTCQCLRKIRSAPGENQIGTGRPTCREGQSGLFDTKTRPETRSVAIAGAANGFWHSRYRLVIPGAHHPIAEVSHGRISRSGRDAAATPPR